MKTARWPWAAASVPVLVLCMLGARGTTLPGVRATAPYGMASRVIPAAYLGLPHRAEDGLPPLLSQTGAFRRLRELEPAAGLMPYELVVPFWSDGAVKTRWVAVPKDKIHFSPDGEWKFPDGTVFVKTFELPTDARDPTQKRRLETRVLVTGSGGVYGATYKWRADGSDADLVTSSTTEDIPVKGADGRVHLQTWFYPGRQDCLTCHTARAGGVLGMKTRQMNRDLAYPGGVNDNELRTWNHLGMFTPALDEAAIGGLPRLAATGDTSRTLEDRARSYLDANCSHCHQPGGTVANFDARYDTPLDHQQLIDGPVLIDQGVDKPRVISPHDTWRSIAFMRMNTVGDIRMPPLARETIDRNGVELLRQWIDSLPGRDVLDPPVIEPASGSFKGAVRVALTERESGAEIHYTLDGSVPGSKDPVYDAPLTITGPTVLRARAYKDGLTRSITSQEVYVVDR